MDSIFEMEEYSKVLNRLQNQCSKREYCSSDIYKKAYSAFDGDRELALQLVDSLVADRFVDDLRYASAFAREKARLSGWGTVKISYMLAGKGIPKDALFVYFSNSCPVRQWYHLYRSIINAALCPPNPKDAETARST